MSPQQYRRRDPVDADETEFMENVFDSLCSALSEESIKAMFLAAEGPDLMVLIMKCVAWSVRVAKLIYTAEKNFKRARALSKRWITPCPALQGPQPARRS